MITLTRGNLLRADAEVLVNTVNCVGFMGKGIALQFKKAFPENFKAYEKACRRKDIQPGRVFVFKTSRLINPRFIINFPTKRHWRGKSRLTDIEAGLKDLVRVVRESGVTSVAVPPLGCGLGGLEWDVVRRMIEEAFDSLPDVTVLLYRPGRTPDAKSMPIGTKKPGLTAARALLIALIDQYSQLSYRLTLLEVQKLAYFLQEAGEPMNLRYQPGPFGPYAHNLNKVLEILEGHYTRGYGDNQAPDVELELLPGASDEASRFLAEQEESRERLQKVASLIQGFETPYGMELLSSTHWVASYQEEKANSVEAAIERIHSWNERKKGMFKPEHIRMSWEHLVDQGWITEP